MTSAGAGRIPAAPPLRGDRPAWVGSAASRRRPRLSGALLALVIVLLAAELAVRLAAGHLPSPQTWSAPEAQHKADQLAGWTGRFGRPDVVVFGASMADNGLDPAVMDTSLGRAGAAYNASLVGTSLESVALWATHFVVPKLRPRVVVLGMSPVELNPNVPNEQSSIEAFRDAPAARRSLGRETLLAKADRLLGDVSSLFRYRKVLRTVTLWTAGRSNGAKGAATVNDPALTPQGMSLTGRDTPYGTFLGRPVSAQTRAGQYQGDLFHHFTIGAEKTAALRQLVVDLRTEGARVVIVELPLTNDAVAYLPHGQGDLTATGEALRLVAGQTGSDYLATGVWPTSLFADPGHLNGRGAEALTTQVMPLILAALHGDGSASP
jgi:hypothetical protein